MKKKVLSLVFVLMAVLPLCAQKHEVGVSGGGMVGQALGKVNDAVKGGMDVGFYYRYVPWKWIGVQSGLSYQYLNENNEMFADKGACRHSFMVPLRLVVLPEARFSLSGGVYMRALMGKADVPYGSIYWEEDKWVDNRGMTHISKRPVAGYEVGAAWNHKYWRLLFSYRRDINSWMPDEDFHEVKGTVYNIFVKEVPKSSMFRIGVEVPLWRGKK